MIKIGDMVIFDSTVDPDDAHLNGSIVKVLAMGEYTQDDFRDKMSLIEFDDGYTMDVETHELREIEGE